MIRLAHSRTTARPTPELRMNDGSTIYQSRRSTSEIGLVDNTLVVLDDDAMTLHHGDKPKLVLVDSPMGNIVHGDDLLGGRR